MAALVAALLFPGGVAAADPSAAPASDPPVASASPLASGPPDPSAEPGPLPDAGRPLTVEELEAERSRSRATGDTEMVVAHVTIDRRAPIRGPLCPPRTARRMGCPFGALDPSPVEDGLVIVWATSRVAARFPDDTPLAQTLVFRIEAGELHLLGGFAMPSGPYPAFDFLTPVDAVAEDAIEGVQGGSIIAVDGWLGVLGWGIPCPAPTPGILFRQGTASPFVRCPGGWITAVGEHPDLPDGAMALEPTGPAIPVQADAYRRYAPDPGPADQGATPPRRAVYLLQHVRNPDPGREPTMGWSVVGRLNPVPPPSETTPTPLVPARWTVAGPVDATDRSLMLLVDGVSCPSVDGSRAEPVVSVASVEGELRIRVEVAAGTDGRPCPVARLRRVPVALAAPLGSHLIVDAAEPDPQRRFPTVHRVDAIDTGLRYSCDGSGDFTVRDILGPGLEVEAPGGPPLRPGWRLLIAEPDHVLQLGPVRRDGADMVEVGSRDGIWEDWASGQCTLLATAIPDRLEPAPWTLRGVPRSTDRELRVWVHERSCASGRPATGRVRRPLVRVDRTRILIVLATRPIGGDCPSNPATPYVIRLPVAIGSRTLVDGSTFPAHERSISPNPPNDGREPVIVGRCGSPGRSSAPIQG